MRVSLVRSDQVYSKILLAPQDKKNDIYRYELMMPFEKKWACYHIPMKAATANGYDVIMASEMLGYLAPAKIDEMQRKNIELLSNDGLWDRCEASISQSLSCFEKAGITLLVKG